MNLEAAIKSEQPTPEHDDSIGPYSYDVIY